ncbi:hypothetical protein LINPERPRIM_LOCUS32576 [Linum perenne]
MNTLLVSLTT